MKFDKNYISDEALERLDDARFALLMEGYSARKGEACMEENLRLQEDGGFELPPELDEKCMKAIDAALARKRRRANMEKAKKIAKRVTVGAASFLVVATLSTVVLYNTVEAFRVVVSDYAIELFDVGDGSIVSVKANDKDSVVNTPVPTWLPDGYSFESDRGNGDMQMLRYTDGTSVIRYVVNKIGAFAIDTEDAATCNDVYVNQFEAMIVEKENVVILYWFDYANDDAYSIWADGLSSDVLVQIAESCYK